MIFRKIEYWIDGDSTKQMQLRKMPWNSFKIKKRVIKFIIFYAISFIIANFFLAYIIGMDKLLEYVSHPAQSIGTFISLMIWNLYFINDFHHYFLFCVLVV